MDMELLAPAGTVPAFEAALAEGADAVYVGAPAFNARALAKDFSLAEIAAMVQFAHDQGKKLYLAMNSLIKEDELHLALETLHQFAQLQVDALIVQDLGLVRLARRFFPQLALHASTLMTAHNSRGVEYLGSLGCKRVVLARELELAEIDQISKAAAKAAVELELFVHGAMCFSYSGLCHFSSLHGGKSSLRGQCVQPCRRRYQWLTSGRAGRTGRAGKKQRSAQDGGYFFSMNDLGGIDQLTALAAAGVTSLKIEGRLKSVAYVRNTVRAYRLALDARKEDSGQRRQDMLREAHKCLDAAMGRRRSSGFFLPGAAGSPALISPGQSGNTGVVVGALQRVDSVWQQGRPVAAQLLAQLTSPVHIGDRLRLHDERSDARYSFTLRLFRVAGKTRRTAQAGELVEMRVADGALCSLRPPFAGTLYRVDVGSRREQVSPGLASLIARQRLEPVPAGFAATLLDKSGASAQPDQSGPTSPFHQDGRRKQRPQHKQSGQKGRQRLPQVQWWLQAASLGGLRLRFPFMVSRFLLELTPENLAQVLGGLQPRILRSIPLTWVIPPVILEERLNWYCQAIARLQAASFTSFQLGHPSQARLFSSADNGHLGKAVELFGDFTFNLLNHSAIMAMAEQGIDAVQFSLETDRQALRTALAAARERRRQEKDAHPCAVGLLVYGRPALFTSRLQAPHFKGRHALLSPHGERYFLKQEQDSVCVYPHQPFSLLAHVHELAASGLDYLVVDISRGNPKQEVATVAALLHGKGELPPHFSGNYSGVLA